MRDENASELLTVEEAANLLRLKPSTMRAWVLRRKIAYVKVGRLVRLRRSDIERLIATGIVPELKPQREETGDAMQATAL